MAIYPVCKTVIARTVAISVMLLAASCSHQPIAGSVAASEATGGIAPVGEPQTPAPAAPPTEPVVKGIKTTHDIYHAKALEVPAGRPVPAVTVRVDEDTVRGWNLYVGTANFTFAPKKVGGESSYSEGHAYLYINDEPAQRIYSTWTHLPTLPPGTHEIRVTLNANGYETLTTQDTPIEDSTTVEVYDPNAD